MVEAASSSLVCYSAAALAELNAMLYSDQKAQKTFVFCAFSFVFSGFSYFFGQTASSIKALTTIATTIDFLRLNKGERKFNLNIHKTSTFAFARGAGFLIKNLSFLLAMQIQVFEPFQPWLANNRIHIQFFR